jgi:hypothetical protein
MSEMSPSPGRERLVRIIVVVVWVAYVALGALFALGDSASTVFGYIGWGIAFVALSVATVAVYRRKGESPSPDR